MSTHTRLITAAAFLLLASTELRASVVTSGFATVVSSTSGSFYFHIDDPFRNLNFASVLETGNWELFQCRPCAVGTAKGVHGLISGDDIPRYGGIFEFFGPPVVLLPGTVYGDFTFNGYLCFGPPSCYLGTLPLTGSGKVEIESLLNPFFVDTIEVQRITYTFNPIPEPSFAPMIALGLTALILRKRFRNSSH